MSNPNLESKVKELMELKRMREELDTEIANIEDISTSSGGQRSHRASLNGCMSTALGLCRWCFL